MSCSSMEVVIVAVVVVDVVVRVVLLVVVDVVVEVVFPLHSLILLGVSHFKLFGLKYKPFSHVS